jgi:hypothetical protein
MPLRVIQQSFNTIYPIQHDHPICPSSDSDAASGPPRAGLAVLYDKARGPRALSDHLDFMAHRASLLVRRPPVACHKAR